jgi:hypothetical protein
MRLPSAIPSPGGGPHCRPSVCVTVNGLAREEQLG